MTTSTSAMRAHERRGFLRQVALDVAYNLAGFPIALVRLVVLVALFGAGAAMAIVFVGLPILVLTLFVARGFADVRPAPAPLGAEPPGTAAPLPEQGVPWRPP